MSTTLSLAAAVTFVWLGMVLAISFLEAPLKFRAPGVTLTIGLGIGRLVFWALNAVESVLALVIVVSLLLGPPAPGAAVTLGVAIAALGVQLVLVRPALTRRTNAVLSGEPTERRSHAHLVYVAVEVIKVVALLLGGTMLLSM